MQEKNEQLYLQLKELHNSLQDNMQSQWQRILPFNEEISDRWGKAKKLGFSQGVSIYDSSFIFGDVSIGENTWVGPFTVLDGTGKLMIGSYCSISTGVQIYTHSSIKWALTQGKSEYEHAPVYIGDSCYLGPNTIVSKGVKISKCCVIGANSFVNKDIPEYSIAFGNPCKVVGEVVFDSQGNPELRYKV